MVELGGLKLCDKLLHTVVRVLAVQLSGANSFIAYPPFSNSLTPTGVMEPQFRKWQKSTLNTLCEFLVLPAQVLLLPMTSGDQLITNLSTMWIITFLNMEQSLLMLHKGFWRIFSHQDSLATYIRWDVLSCCQSFETSNWYLGSSVCIRRCSSRCHYCVICPVVSLFI